MALNRGAITHPVLRPSVVGLQVRPSESLGTSPAYLFQIWLLPLLLAFALSGDLRPPRKAQATLDTPIRTGRAMAEVVPPQQVTVHVRLPSQLNGTCNYKLELQL